ncbi:hypothetical protein B0H10DRAFT_2011453 [Mycena sp. CBHHK59/15]|nr:hypothetical protein B0H10DRAFT_2011453 [Mycena sp. CBHHK59/15]
MDLEKQAKRRIEECEENIARIDSQIRDLVRLRDRERGIIASLRLFICPIRTLPCELLTDIFRLILALCQVCAYWRKVAQTDPRLWAHLELPILIPKKGEMILAATEMFMERSAPLPIPVSLRLNSPTASVVDLQLAARMLGVAHRWRTFTFSGSPLDGLKFLSQIPSTALKQLERLDLRLCGRGMDYYHSTQSNITVFLSAPRLCSLTHLALRDDSTQVCFDVLVRCPNIVSATLKSLGWPKPAFAAAANVEPVILAHLTFLDIYMELGETGEHFTPFFRRLQLPVLRTLALSVYDNNDLLQWSERYFSLFQTHSPLIEHLTIEFSALHHAPALTHLELCCFARLPAPRPQTDTLMLGSVGGEFDELSFQEMIESRWWTDDRLLTMTPPPSVARFKCVHYWDEGAPQEVRFGETVDD